MRIVYSGIAVSILCTIHVLFPNIERGLHRYKHIWVPASGGMTLGYVFMYMLPRLSDDTALIIYNEPSGWEFLHYRLYLVAMIGFLTYLIVDIGGSSKNLKSNYWRLIQNACFCFYNLLIGYIFFNLPRAGILPHLLAILIFSAHFMGLDYLFYKSKPNDYKRSLRWLVAVSLITGWIVGLTTELPETIKTGSTAFIAGGALITAFTKRLPDTGEDHLRPFLGGVGLLVVIVAVIRSLSKV